MCVCMQLSPSIKIHKYFPASLCTHTSLNIWMKNLPPTSLQMMLTVRGQANSVMKCLIVFTQRSYDNLWRYES